MSQRDYMTRDELFTWREERIDAAERRAGVRERFEEPTEEQVKAELARREKEKRS